MGKALTFGSYLASLRERQNLTKTDLAKILEVTIGYVVNLESGRRKPPKLDKCKRIIATLSLDAAESVHMMMLAVQERATKEMGQFFQWVIENCDIEISPKPLTQEEKAKFSKLWTHQTITEEDLAEAIKDPIACDALILAKQDLHFRKMVEELGQLPLDKKPQFLNLFHQLHGLVNTR
ncbi:MAG: helix-turn-helix domain-containing protein [Candidatus Margulisiibacteriota bacterium]